MSPSKKVPIIIRVVCDFYGTAPEVVCSKKPTDKNNTEARHVAMLIIRRHTTYTIGRIAEFFGYAPNYNSAIINSISHRESRDITLKRTIAEIEHILFTKYKS